MRIRMTQAFVDKLASADPPARDVLFWDASACRASASP